MELSEVFATQKDINYWNEFVRKLPQHYFLDFSLFVLFFCFSFSSIFFQIPVEIELNWVYYHFSRQPKHLEKYQNSFWSKTCTTRLAETKWKTSIFFQKRKTTSIFYKRKTISLFFKSCRLNLAETKWKTISIISKLDTTSNISSCKKSFDETLLASLA